MILIVKWWVLVSKISDSLYEADCENLGTKRVSVIVNYAIKRNFFNKIIMQYIKLNNKIVEKKNPSIQLYLIKHQHRYILKVS